MNLLSKDAYLFDSKGYTQQKNIEVRRDEEHLYVGASKHKLDDFLFELENHGNNTRITSKLAGWFIIL